MLGKLIKYDMRSMMRSLLPLLLAVLAASVLTGGSFLVMQNMPNPRTPVGRLVETSVNVLLVVLIAAIFMSMLVCVFIIFQRIYRSMFSQEGYLTFTLPVSPSAVVSSKVISAVVWEIICGIVVALAVCIFAVIIVLGTDITFFEDVIRFIDRAMDFVTAEIVLIMFELLLCMLVGMVMTTLMIMTSLSVGAVIARKHKVLAAILVFFVIQVVINTVVSSLMMSVPAQLMAYDTTEQFYGILNRAFLQYAVIDLAVSAILFFAERFVISRKLNI